MLLKRPHSVVHLGQSALVLRDPLTRHLVTITGNAGGVIPGGVSVPSSTHFARIRRECSGASEVDFGGWSSARRETVDLHLMRSFVPHDAVEAVAHSITTPSVSFDAGLASSRARATELAKASLGGDLTVVADLVGAGPGTTPTGDDMIVGTLAAQRISGNLTNADRLAHAVAPLLHRTTEASRHYLTAAASGRFAEHVHDVVDFLARDVKASHIIALANGWGATSGIDLLVGLTATLRELSRTSNLEGAA